ncbi:MAG: A/G-specific adenine glycosylase [Lachnospiraceae bacterium]|nr:A/G-specific adenine glycosylase [Lachnospiraceae bacterium]
MSKQLEIKYDIVSPLLAWYDEDHRDLPWRSEPAPYRVWVSEIMLQQTRVEAVKPYFERFMKELPTIEKLAYANEDTLLKLWEGLGYYNRIRNMQKAARMVCEQYGGNFPDTYDEIVKLPGIGSYTAGAIASICFERPVPAVDGNVMRIVSRLMRYEGDILKESSKKEIREALLPHMPEGESGKFNQAMMELGATVCVPNGAPACERCPWARLCACASRSSSGIVEAGGEAEKAKGTKRSGEIAELWREYPKKSGAKKRRIEKKTILILGDRDHVLLHKRPDKGLLAGMYELPAMEGHVAQREILSFIGQLGFHPLRIRHAGDAKHIFSHIEWHMKGYQILLEADDIEHAPDGFVFATLEEARTDYAIPSAFAAYADALRLRDVTWKKGEVPQ